MFTPEMENYVCLTPEQKYSIFEVVLIIICHCVLFYTTAFKRKYSLTKYITEAEIKSTL